VRAGMRRRYAIRTYGCQMNVHDSEKVANLLHHVGFRRAEDEASADLLVINTCSIRERAEHRLYSDLGALRSWKEEAPGRILGVGGCVAQQEGDAIQRRHPHVDFVFGTHNLRHVPAMVAAASEGQREARTAETLSQERFDLPERHAAYAGETPGRAWLTVMEGCDMFCSFCIVPRTRGREISRPAEAIRAEARQLAERGTRELTLLGQTVNAYGRHDRRRGREGDSGTCAFGDLLGDLAAIPDIERIRYTSPHPLFFDEALVRAHGELPELCPHVHLPLQSGSDRVLEAMRRRYTAAEYLAIVERLRAARPDIAITTDLIVGFPGETREDFQATLALLSEVGFVDSYRFKYSPRPGTAAEAMAGAVEPEEAKDRLDALHAAQRELTLKAHRDRVGTVTEVLVEGPSHRDRGAGGPEAQLRGRDPYHRVVNFAAGEAPPAPGTIVRLAVAEATPHSLIGLAEGEARQDVLPLKEPARSADELGRRSTSAPV
jgi:tRNA-2-methylthio-N6-dimethylallyladenosine synthase